MGLGDLLSGMVSVKEMSGPVGIVSTIVDTGRSAVSVADGLLNVAYLGAFIAINLAVMNMLPLPALDGGRISCCWSARCSPRSPKRRSPPSMRAISTQSG